jgi:hypothetical protein
MKRYLFSTLLTGAALALFTASALADDLNPPPWRGDPGSTWEEWEFKTSSPLALPSGAVNIYGTPYALVEGHDWQFSVGAREGVWSLSGLMAIYVPNTPELWVKTVLLQLTYRDTPGDAVTGTPDIGMVNNVGVAFPLTPTLTQVLPDGWTYCLYTGTIDPNPPFEVIGIGGDIDVDQIVIDTFCPEPQTYGLLAGLGLLGFGVWRRMRT